MTASLQLQTCRPVTGGAVMTPGEWRPLLAQLTGWTVAADVLEKRFDFPDFRRTMAFINGVACGLGSAASTGIGNGAIGAGVVWRRNA